MSTAGEKLSTPLPDITNEYWMISNPTPGEGVNIYILDTGVMTDHVGFRNNANEKRARNFKGLRDSDMSPYVDETMVGSTLDLKK